MPFGLMTPASWVAMFTQRYMHETGCTSSDLAQVAVSTRKHAVNNPNAFFYGKPLTIEEHQSSRDDRRAAAALRLLPGDRRRLRRIVTTPERARDLAQPGALIRGVAQAAGADQEVMTSFYRPNIAALPEMDLVAKQVYAKSGLGPADLDAAVIYDAFTSIVLWQLETFGLCGRGEAKDFVKDGTLELGGRLPVQHARRPALRGLHPRHERRERGRAADPRHLGEPAEEERPRARDRRRRRADERHDPRKVT